MTLEQLLKMELIWKNIGATLVWVTQYKGVHFFAEIVEPGRDAWAVIREGPDEVLGDVATRPLLWRNLPLRIARESTGPIFLSQHTVL